MRYSTDSSSKLLWPVDPAHADARAESERVLRPTSIIKTKGLFLPRRLLDWQCRRSLSPPEDFGYERPQSGSESLQRSRGLLENQVNAETLGCHSSGGHPARVEF
jgi:hypothetical protein